MSRNSSRDKHRLTPREHMVWEQLVTTARSIKEIAAHLNRQYHTIRTQTERIFRKHGVHSRLELIKLAKERA